MKVSVLTTGTSNVPPIIEPLSAFAQLSWLRYDQVEHKRLVAAVDRARPDWVLLIGAIPGHYEHAIKDVGIFAAIGAKRPLVHLCFDGAEPAWWPFLREYYDHGRFALQVNIDGVRTGPIGDRGFTTLAPVDVSLYRDEPHSCRPIVCGFSGSILPHRTATLGNLVSRWLVTFRERDAEGDHAQYRSFLGMCRSGINLPETGGGTGALHVKHRVLELAAAGCLVLEQKGSPLADWFVPGEDYLEYDGVGGAAERIMWVRGHPVECEKIAQRLCVKVAASHTSKIFWSQVLERLGHGEALVEAPESPYRGWSIPAPAKIPATVADIGALAPPLINPHRHMPPQLVASMRGYNLVRWQNRIWSIPQSLGPVQVDKIDLSKVASVRVYSDVLHARNAVMG